MDPRPLSSFPSPPYLSPPSPAEYRFLKADVYLQMELSPLSKLPPGRSPYHHSNLSLANSLLPRPLSKRGYWIGGRPRAQMGGVTNRPSSHFGGVGSALFMQCTDTQFHFLFGNKLIVSSSHHLLFRKREYPGGSPVVCQHLGVLCLKKD